MHAAWEPLIENRMRVADARLGAIGSIRPRVAARVGQLQADAQIVGGAGAVALAMGGDELVAQPREPRSVSR